MLDHRLLAALDSASPVSHPKRRGSVGGEAETDAAASSVMDKLGGRMTVFMALGGLVGAPPPPPTTKGKG